MNEETEVPSWLLSNPFVTVTEGNATDQEEKPWGMAVVEDNDDVVVRYYHELPASAWHFLRKHDEAPKYPVLPNRKRDSNDELMTALGRAPVSITKRGVSFGFQGIREESNWEIERRLNLDLPWKATPCGGTKQELPEGTERELVIERNTYHDHNWFSHVTNQRVKP